MNYLTLLAAMLGAVMLSCASEYHHDHHHAPAPYKFEYGVHDAHTGDIKEAKEASDHSAVKGYYRLKEADGTTRIVHYTADKHNGFQAHVEKVGHAHHPAHHEHHHHLKALHHDGIVEHVHDPHHHYPHYPYAYGYATVDHHYPLYYHEYDHHHLLKHH